MKKTSAKPRVRRSGPRDSDEIPAEIDFRGAVRNPCAVRYATGSNIVVLEPDVAALFPNSVAVNDALRSLARVMAGRKAARSARHGTA